MKDNNPVAKDRVKRAEARITVVTSVSDGRYTGDKGCIKRE